MLFRFIKNIANGRGRAFFIAFTGFHYQLLDAAGKLPPVEDAAVQQFVLRMLRAYIETNRTFTETLFYGVGDNPPIFSLEELRSLGESNGNRLYSLFLISLMRVSLFSEPKLADLFVTLALAMIPQKCRPAAQRLSAALRDQTPFECERIVTDIVRQIFSEPMQDPVRRMGFIAVLWAAAGNLHEQANNALQPPAGTA